MQQKYLPFIGFGLILALTFGVGFKLGQHREVLTVYARSNSAQQVNQKLSLSATRSNQAAAIVLMPKSYLPLLEKFKHRKIAREIKILPARIGWDDDQMIAIPQKAILKDTGAPDASIVNISHRSQIKTQKENPARSKMAQGAAFLFLLKSTAQNKLRYAAQPPATAKAGL
ncbi:MAG: hypothetical protein PVG17_21555 [Desulfobacterales bacterium]|jgi:hypothetical protein